MFEYVFHRGCVAYVLKSEIEITYSKHCDGILMQFEPLRLFECEDSLVECHSEFGISLDSLWRNYVVADKSELTLDAIEFGEKIKSMVTRIEPSLLTVQRCHNDDSLYGHTHAADHDEHTICGLELNSHWYVTDDTFTGKVTCKKCLKILSTTILPQRAKAEQEKKKKNKSAL